MKKHKKASVTKNSKRKKREIRRFLVVVAILVFGVGGGLAAFKHNYDITHNLADIGQGTPVVVQIHDPGCQLCLQLRKNANSAIDKLDGDLLFRIADITTPQGRALQLRHDVGNVTLLLFDGKGELRNVLKGVKSDELLHKTFTSHIERWQRVS